jgi:uncharacterized protein
VDFLAQPWPWYVSGPLIGLTVPMLLLLVGKPLGVSSSFRHLNAACSPGTAVDYLADDDLRGEAWSLLFVVGLLAGGYLAAHWLSAGPVELLPASMHNVSGALRLLIGGVLVGFGTRYADGCTSGHSIMGLSNLNWVSLVATCSFFAGGLLVVWVFPLITG